MKHKKPNTLFICCCDNRVIPYEFSQKETGDLFVLRNIGNIIPPYEASENSVTAAIEYAIEHLKCPHIIVCRHSDCGGMKAVLGEMTKETGLGTWLQYAVPKKNIASPDELSKANVLHQIKNLMTYPAVAKGVREATLTIHGWWFDIDTNSVHQISP